MKTLMTGVLLVVALAIGAVLISNTQEEKTLIVYPGKGQAIPLCDIKTAFEQKYNVKLEIIYAGSVTGLNTIEETNPYYS